MYLANKEIRRSKRIYEKKLADNIKSDVKSFYSYARKKTRVNDSVGPLIDDDNKLVTDDAVQAEMLNSFFSSVFTNEILGEVSLPSDFLSLTSDQCITDVDFSPCVVKKYLDKLKPNSAPGNDEIHTTILIEASLQLSVPLFMIFRKSLDNSSVPADWKQANVTPLFKKGNKNCCCNYRPVSLTSHVVKVLERILKDNINIHLDRYNLIKSSQHGFTHGRSCVSNLLSFLELLTKYIDSGCSCDVVYLDFAKAFDKVPHNRLLVKLRSHGVTGKLADWIECWLSERVQRVVLRGAASSWKPVLSGVQQG